MTAQEVGRRGKPISLAACEVDPTVAVDPELQHTSRQELCLSDKLGTTIITMPAGQPTGQLHDRQPAILDPAVYDAWLDPRDT